MLASVYLTVGTSIIAFTLVILFLVMALLFAQSKLIQSGDVNIYVNGDESNPLIVPAGSTLLTTLSSQKMFLPSACGGGGTCAMCKCKIHEGGGDVLPTEVGHLSRTEQHENVRLSCQVKVKEDMIIEIPDEIFEYDPACNALVVVTLVAVISPPTVKSLLLGL